MKSQLYIKNNNIQFYEERYENGYMDEWPIDKKQRVYEIIKELNLPVSGRALDFGCGNGVFTDVLRQALPNWEIFGCDISKNAIENAKNRYPDCHFFISDNDLKTELKFDFLFTHHVLEHVFDIKEIVFEINSFLNPSSFMLHILPCGNRDSFEYKICNIRVDGINSEMENRFFYEDKGHIRRLITDQALILFQACDFFLEKEFYSNQYNGAIKWITQSSPKFILELTNPNKGRDMKSYIILLFLRFKLLLLFILQAPIVIHNHLNLIKNKKIAHHIFWIINLVPRLFSYPTYFIVNIKAKNEWNKNKHLKNGSEMYLFFKR